MEKTPPPPLRFLNSNLVPRKFAPRVFYRYDADGYFYPGTVERDANNQSIVFFDNEIEQPLSGHAVIPYEQTNNQLRLYLHDCVLARLTNEQEEFWVPGLIRCPPTSPYALPPQVYLVEIHNPTPQQVEGERRNQRSTICLFACRSIRIGKI